MKSLIKIVSILTLTVGLLSANPIEIKSSKGGYDITITSKKSLVVGDNEFFITLIKDGEVTKDAKVKIKAFMPEMPGMPYMENKQHAKLIDGKYKVPVNFSMSGTWQIHLMFKTADEKVYKVRSSINL